MILAPHGSYALLASAVAMLAYVMAAAWADGSGVGGARRALWVGWLSHALALVLGLISEPPRFGFGPAVSATMWLVLSVVATEQQALHDKTGVRVLALLCAVGAGIALWFPGRAVAALHSAWLPLHWALGFASYGLFGAALVHARLTELTEHRMRKGEPAPMGLPLLRHERLAFRFVGVGFALLSATLVAGWLFGEALSSHGSRVRWDHKMVFSHLSWVTFAALLVGRMVFGWRGKAAARMIYVGCGLLLLAYIGSRFVLEVVLGRAA